MQGKRSWFCIKSIATVQLQNIRRENFSSSSKNCEMFLSHLAIAFVVSRYLRDIEKIIVCCMYEPF